MIDILVFFGPSLNMLGTREPHIYGSDTLADTKAELEAQARGLDCEITIMGSNDKSTIVTKIQQARGTAKIILFNLAAYTHTSIALRDALAMFDGPKVEVHLSNNYQREAFREISLTAPVSNGLIVGFGSDSFLLGLNAVDGLLKRLKTIPVK